MNSIKLNGQLKTYFRWPLFLTILWAVMVIGLFFIDIKAGLLGTLGLLIYGIAAGVLYARNRSMLMHELISFAASYGQVQKQLLKELVVPYALMDSEGKMLWMNDEFMEICEKDKKVYQLSCRQRAMKLFDKNERFIEYINLYKQLI